MEREKSRVSRSTLGHLPHSQAAHVNGRGTARSLGPAAHSMPQRHKSGRCSTHWAVAIPAALADPLSLPAVGPLGLSGHACQRFVWAMLSMWRSDVLFMIW